MTLWIEISKDKYKTIVDFDTDPNALADRAGVSAHAVKMSHYNSIRRHKDYRFMRIDIDEEGENDEVN